MGIIMTEPCIRCGVDVDADVHEEELGFCLECSSLFWEDKLDPVTLELLR